MKKTKLKPVSLICQEHQRLRTIKENPVYIDDQKIETD